MLQRLDVKLVLAAISGVLVGTELFDLPRPGVELFFGLPTLLYDYVLVGALFAIPILWPYLRRSDHFLLRGLALVFASALSYWCATSVHDEVPGGSSLPWFVPVEFVGSSIVGAGIVFAAAKYGVPFNWSKRYVLLGIVSAVAGGWAFALLADVPGPDFLFSFIGWHCIMCAALHFGTRRVGEPGHA